MAEQMASKDKVADSEDIKSESTQSVQEEQTKQNEAKEIPVQCLKIYESVGSQQYNFLL